MALTAAEQYLVELINRARLDPLGEAGRYGIDLNDGLEPGQLDGSARQPLAPNQFLSLAAADHSLWMLANDIFSHTGAGGSTPTQRMAAAGYTFTGSWTSGENISASFSTGPISLDAEISTHHQGLFESPGHRVNILNGNFAEVGVGQEAGLFTYNGVTYNASMLTETFARSGTQVFLTGVVYNDSDVDDFYSIGEGIGGASIQSGAAVTQSEAAGGYALGLTPGAAVEAAITGSGGTEVRFIVDMSGGNAKVDLVNGTYLKASVDLTLVSGATGATLLGVADLSLTGSNSAEKLVGNKGNNEIDGGGGKDILNGGVGADTMIGGNGSDTFYVDNAGDVVTETNATASTGGTDTVYSYLAAYTLGANVENGRILATGAANLTGNTLNNVLYAGAGNNVLNGGTGTDTADYRYAASAVTVNLALTTAQATGGSGSDTLAAIESLTGSNYNDTLVGNTGANALNGLGGADKMTGGDGSDTYFVDNAGDVVTETNATAGTGGTDQVNSYLAAYTLGANVEKGRILATGAANLTGNTLNNVLYAGAGNNVLNGGAGTDTADYRYAASAVTVNLALTTGQATGGSGSDTLAAIENLTGSNYNDTLTGNTGANALNGLGGADKMTGGDGSDTYFVDNAGDVVTETNATAGTGGTDLVNSYLAAYTLGANVENGRILATGAANLTGNTLSNVLQAGAGNNVLNGGTGTDTADYRYAASAVTVNLTLTTAQATGGSGSDTLAAIENLTGSNYNDTLTGNTGANVINGNAGNDTLAGGTGADIFRFDSLLNAATNVDKITDFSVADDTIQLENSIFTALTATGTLTAAAFGVWTAPQADDRVLYNAATGNLYYDADGSGAGASILFAQVTPNLALTNADFVVT